MYYDSEITNFTTVKLNIENCVSEIISENELLLQPQYSNYFDSDN